MTRAAKLPRALPRFSFVAALLCLLMINSCVYEVPISDQPSRKIEPKLLGNWTTNDGKEKMKVRRLDDSVYIVSYNGDLFRAYHTDVGKLPLVSVQDIDSCDRKYSYMTWRLSADGNELGLRVVDEKVVSPEIKDSAGIRKLLEKEAGNSALFREEEMFKREAENKPNLPAPSSPQSSP